MVGIEIDSCEYILCARRELRAFINGAVVGAERPQPRQWILNRGSFFCFAGPGRAGDQLRKHLTQLLRKIIAVDISLNGTVSGSKKWSLLLGQWVPKSEKICSIFVKDFLPGLSAPDWFRLCLCGGIGWNFQSN